MASPPLGLETPVSFSNDVSKNAFVAELKKTTPARIGIGHAGGRYPTMAQLKFKEDLAVSKDAVHRDVPNQFIQALGLISLQSRVNDRAEYLKNTTLGRFLNDASVEELEKRASGTYDVQIITSDGLSSEAFEKNVPIMLPLMKARLVEEGLSVAPSLFVRWARVALIDHVGELVKPKAAIILLGERPGLGISDSLSGYFEYQPNKTRIESDRNVLSNIHRLGMPPPEAALLLAEALIRVIALKKSGMTIRFDFV